ncbi:MAG: copper amine oxidase N-terminal domain-containing protein [Defluviitaleaceae bacterium]|nr:copper amine oxidase N-terminal domain-containing protein [Defluviitaleaceae bacterium]
MDRRGFKKRIFTLFLAVALAIVAISIVAMADDEIRVTVAGQVVDFPGGQGAVLVDGRTLVPVRGVFEMLGFEVDWDAETRTTILISAEHEVHITIDSDVFIANGASYTLDVPAQLIGGRTMVPIRLPLESVGYYLDWDGTARTVLIASESAASTQPTARAGLPDATPAPVAAPTPTPSPAPSPTPAPEPTPTPVAGNVWLSATGSRYHRINNCGNMNPARARSVTRTYAQNRGFTACARCW